jgi:hypothetical protein
MYNPTEILIDSFVGTLRAFYEQTFGRYKPEQGEIANWAARMALENIANGDALYHDVEHTMLVTMVGIHILRGKHMSEGGVSPETWMHAVLSLVCHDIGYVKGVCLSDRPEQRRYATGRGEEFIELPHGASDASLSGHHIERGQMFVDERFGGHAVIRAEIIKMNIEKTRFPIPDSEPAGMARRPVEPTFGTVVPLPELIRAADLIGQLGDPRYLQKIHALFYEFEEIGVNKKLGYRTPGDVLDSYPSFYWKRVYPHVQEGIRYLEVTQEGKQVLANLYANVYRREHAQPPPTED